jgi:KaiC/GvpD/RAD55 family RecA-like ATPase
MPVATLGPGLRVAFAARVPARPRFGSAVSSPLYLFSRVANHATVVTSITRDPSSAGELVTVPDGASVLVAGPVLSAKRTLMLAMLASRANGGVDRGTVVVSTRKPARATVRQYEELGGPVESDRIAVVDCTGLDIDSTGRGADRRVRHRSVSGPGDLTGLGIRVSELLGGFQADGLAGQVGLHSLSTMLMYADVRRLYQFLHVVTGRAAATGFATVCTLDRGVVEDREERILTQPFDGVVEVRQHDPDRGGGKQLRVAGDVEGPDGWTSFGW